MRNDCPDCAYGQQEEPDGVLYRCGTCDGTGKRPVAFELSREAHIGFTLAKSHAVLNEAGARDNGLPTLSESGLTPLEAHAKLAYWLGQLLTGDPVEALAVLSYQAAALA